MTEMTRNDILEGAAKLYEDGMPLAHTTLANLTDGMDGQVTCAACGLGALLIASGVVCRVLAEAPDQDPFYDLCEPTEGAMTPLKEAVIVTADALDARRGPGYGDVSAIYAFSDSLRTAEPLIALFRKAKELP